MKLKTYLVFDKQNRIRNFFYVRRNLMYHIFSTMMLGGDYATEKEVKKELDNQDKGYYSYL